MGPQDHDVNLQPDPDTISIVPWYDEPTAQVIVDCFNQDGSLSKTMATPFDLMTTRSAFRDGAAPARRNRTVSKRP